MTPILPLLFRDVPFQMHLPGSVGQLERCYFRVVRDPQLLVGDGGSGKSAMLRRLVETLESSNDLGAVEHCGPVGKDGSS